MDSGAGARNLKSRHSKKRGQELHGKVLESELAPKVLATVHPSSLLRQPDEESREREYKNFVADLQAAVKAAGYPA